MSMFFCNDNDQSAFDETISKQVQREKLRKSLEVLSDELIRSNLEIAINGLKEELRSDDSDKSMGGFGEY